MRPATRYRLAIGIILILAGVAAWLRFGPGVSAPTAAVAPAPQYVDETARSGLIHTDGGSSDFAVGGGVAVFDCNDDGRPDVYLAGGEQPAALFRNDSPIGGSLAFTALPDPITDLTSVNGAYPIDIDGDGHTDLVVLRNGGNAVLRGLGGCHFSDATKAWGVDPGTRHTEAFSATWELGSNWPTVAFGNYVDPAVTEPTAWCEPNQLVRPAVGGAGFAAPVALTPSWCALSMLFSDWDGSGRRDLRVSNDEHYYPPSVGQEQLWRIEPGRPPRLYTAAEGWVQVQVQGMGIASYDLTGDGLPEVFLTSQAANRLQTLSAGPAQPAYHDIGLQHQVNVAHPFTGSDQALPSTAWHPEFADVNNDGLIDLFVSKGNVGSQPDYALQDPSDLLLGQPDGTFVEAADRAGIVSFDRGRGAALVDLNLDGRLDLIEAFYGAPAKVWRNTGPVDTSGASLGAHWVAVRLEESGPNLDAIGALIELRIGDLVSRREVTIGGGHAGGQLGWIHFGLGPASGADVRVTWPDGEVGPWQPVSADAFGIVDRGASTVRAWQPPR